MRDNSIEDEAVRVTWTGDRRCRDRRREECGGYQFGCHLVSFSEALALPNAALERRKGQLPC